LRVYLLRLVIQLDDHVAEHGDGRAIGRLGVGVDHNVVHGHLLLLVLLEHLLVEGGLLHLVVAGELEVGGHRRLLLVLFKRRGRHVGIVELGLERRIHELPLVRVHVHRRGRHHHLHVVLLRGELVLRLAVVTLAAKILVHAARHLLHIVDLLLLEEEGVGGGRDLVGALVVLAWGSVRPATLVVGVATAAAAAVLVMLVAGHGAKFGLSVGKCAVSSIRASLISLEELAFNSFEIVTEAALSLLGLSVSILPAVWLSAATTVVALAGV
jgi:hypothetical protein